MLEVPNSDLDFYKRKIIRLETDLATLQQQLSNARMRLRTAEDFQIKYDLLLRQSQQENHRLKMAQKAQEIRKQEIAQSRIRQNQAKWEHRIKEQQLQIRSQYQSKIEQIYKQTKQQIKKIQEASEKSERVQNLQFKVKKLQSQKRGLENQLDQIKVLHQKQKQQQLLAIKDSFNAKMKQKNNSDKLSNQNKVQQLQSIIKTQQLEIEAYKMKLKPKDVTQILEKTKEQFKLRSNDIQKEIQRLTSTLRLKIEQVDQLMTDKINLQQTIRTLKKQHRDYTNLLEGKLFQKQKEHEAQLVNLKQRMTKIRQQQIQQLKNQIDKGQETFNSQRNSWEHIINQKEQQRNKLKHLFDDQRNKWNQDKLLLKKKIQQLKQRLKQAEATRQLGQTEQLLNSLRDLQNREDHFSNYENGVTFLERQLKKAILKLQGKHMQVKKLLKQIATIREQFEHEQQESRQKHKLQKKELNEKILKIETYNRQLNDAIRQRDKQIKKAKKDEQSKRQILEAEVKNLKELNQQFQRDYNRVIENKKTIEQSYREERQKSIVSKSQIHLTRRDKWLELEKQKNDLMVIFKEKEEQSKMIHDVQRQKLRVERDKLKQQNQILKQQKRLQDQQMRRIVDDKQNQRSQKMAEYNKKMATVDLQLALTQNLYNSLLQAKTRARRPLHDTQQVDSSSEPQIRFGKNSNNNHEQQQGSNLNMQDCQSPMFNLVNYGTTQSKATKIGLLDSFGPMMKKKETK